MSHNPNTPRNRLGQLRNMARAKTDVGQASALEEAIPGLVEEILALRAERERAEAEKRVALDIMNGENLTGEYVHRPDAEGLPADPVHEPPHNPAPDNSSPREAVLHLYPLGMEHGDAMLSGNLEGLRMLEVRLGRFLAGAPRGHYIDHGYSDDPQTKLFTADGEEYHLAIECRPAGVHDPDWQKRPEPYYVSRRRARRAGMAV